ncbi:MAG: SDR family NAD(P)-dependent oxidoreductase [Actinobacteria bacterium]|nr:MAG: SDR family NAD(P)-dependent oxidoreductase [Actinomycetota bacterium]REK36432.1 MAG: SDR family NAD(P)-dependent oxidoreductase [Actinomycetota bacterium]
MSDPITFDGRVAVVTGAGGGLGKGYALELARRGARVVVNDLGGAVDGSGSSKAAADVVVDEITEAGGEAVANYDSVSTRDGGEGIIQTALDSFGTVDIVINNAGILRDKSFANMSLDEVEAVLDVHLKGAFYVSHPAFKVMKEKGYGRLVHTTSASGLFGNFGQANYGAAKAGLVGLSNVLAIEGAKYNIKSNAVAPTAKTRMTEELLGPFADMFDTDQVTPLVVYLCSEANENTHQIFSVGGGRYARIFLGTNRGWFAGQGEVPSVEDVAGHMDEVMDVAEYEIPMNINDELTMLAGILAG